MIDLGLICILTILYASLILHCFNFVLFRLLHEQEIKVRSVELQVANLQCEKDNLEKVSKDRCIEFTRKLERAEENHAVECYQIKENFQKKIWYV